ncbi:prolipoprotein diacylglyceryl transferase family protein [Desulfosporosinus sp. I2]|uniref:hypothetical protein n=1 Tax=Desulfosporosinus sp. I2 TaxID=1617025 RepID=UPI0005EF7A50|nr:hypothetical protein [Desulfosporosinus sp. I2]KJR46744.1 prolipoprotein diacylglyceryl transferase family protein [Desulfosporosinus sp. I2]
MNETLQVGPFLLKTHWLVVIFSASVGYFIMRYRLKAAGYPDKRMIETIENSLITALMVWKFSLILFDPVSVVTNPLALLYFSGGEHGIWLAAVVAIVYFYLRAQKDQVSVWVYGDLLAAGFLAATAVYYLIDMVGNKQMVWVDGSEIIIALLILLLIFRRSKEIGKPNHLNQVLLWFSLGQVGIAFLNPLKQNYWWGFSQEQILYLSLAALCLAIDLFPEKKRLNKNA